MNAPFRELQTGALCSIPPEFEPPLVLPGAGIQRYERMHESIFLELAPRSVRSRRGPAGRQIAKRSQLMRKRDDLIPTD
jgi:hypothetical protein